MSSIKTLTIGGVSYDLKATSVVDNNGSGSLKYWTGTSSDYEGLAIKNADTYYACTDTGALYLGTCEIGIATNSSHALKCYKDSGELLTDVEGLTDVMKYVDSAYDIANFIVVGSPSITENGVMSGLSSSNYVATKNLKNHDLLNRSWSIISGTINYNAGTVYPILIAPAGSYGNDFSHATDGSICISNHYITMYVNTPSSQERGDNQQTVDKYFTTMPTKFRVRMDFDYPTGTYTGYYDVFDGNGWQLLGEPIVPYTDEKQLFDIVYENDKEISIGYCSTNSSSTIDLSQYEVYIDGTPVFSGKNIGIDVIKADDYTVVGSPTISADGVASGFSNSKYLTKSSAITIGSSGEFHIDFAFKSSQYTSSQYILDVYNTNANEIILRRNANGDSYTCVVFVNTPAIFNKNITTTADYIEGYIEYKDGTYKFSINGSTETLVSSTKPTATTYNVTLGCRTSSSATEALVNGFIDLNAFRIYVDGDLVYQPCLKIPYIQSKTGSKIVNSKYLSRVSDMYEQFGYAPYYSLQEGSEPNFVTVGSPTISSDWVASGFSGTSYLTISVPQTTANSIKLTGKFKTGNMSATLECLLTGNANYKFMLLLVSGNLCISIGDGSTWAYSDAKVVKAVTAYTEYEYDLTITTTQVTGTVNGVAITPITLTSTATLNPSASFATIGMRTYGGQSYWYGSIDLKAFKVYTDGKLTYQAVQPPCFTLPQGEIYGNIRETAVDEIENKSLVASGYLNEGYKITKKEDIKTVYNYAHSTFDESKFTKVGSPTIVDGVMSNISVSRYAKMDTFDPSARSFEVNLKFRLNSISNGTFNLVSENYDGNTGKLQGFSIALVRSGSSYSTQVLICNGTSYLTISGNNYYDINTDYYIKLVNTGFSYALYCSTDGQNYKQDGGTQSYQYNTFSRSEANPTTLYFGVQCSIGASSSTTSNGFTVGSLDLKYFSVKVFGEPVLSGNKTSIDTIKAKNYTIVGSPTISNDGIASGFSTSNYLTFDTNRLSSTSSWEIISPKIRINEEGISQCALWLGVISSGRLFIIFRDTGNILIKLQVQPAGDLITYNSYTYNTSDTYQFKITYSNNTCKIYQSVNSGVYVQVETADIATAFNLDNEEYGIGKNLEDNNQGFTSGQIDLNAFKIYVDGKLVYQPCLKIPYTQSNTGSKIVDSYYENRVVDAYNQVGSQSYYILDDDYVAKPLGEVYGLMNFLAGGSWEYRDVVLSNSTSSSYTGTISLSSILPNDGYSYECIFRTQLNSGTYAGSATFKTLIEGDWNTFFATNTNPYYAGQFIGIIDNSRVIQIKITADHDLTSHQTCLVYYRRTAPGGVHTVLS